MSLSRCTCEPGKYLYYLHSQDTNKIERLAPLASSMFEQKVNPKLIEEYNNPFELLVIEVETQDKNIRIITGCGPQENWDEDKRMHFFHCARNRNS